MAETPSRPSEETLLPPSPSPQPRNAWLPLLVVVGVFCLLSILGFIASMLSFGRGVSRSLSKAPAIDARWIEAAPGSSVRIGQTIVARVQVIAGTRAPQFGVDSFMVFVARSEPSSKHLFQPRDSLAALLRPITQWSEPIDVELVRFSTLRGLPRVGTLRIDDLHLSIGMFRGESPERSTAP